MALRSEQVAIGVDLGGTTTKLVVLADSGIQSSEVMPTPDGEWNETLDAIAAWVASVPRMPEAPVGLAIPGPVPAEGDSLFVPNLAGDWSGVDLTLEILKKTGRRPVLINDAHAYALGEARLGAAAKATDAVVLTLGTGVGGGITCAGNLYLGATRRAGELGHIVVEPDGDPCVCGNSGCLESVASATAMARHAGGVGPDDLPEIADRARHGEEAAIASFHRAATGLGLALTAIAAVVAPQIAVFGGGAGVGVFDLINERALEVLGRRSLLMEPMSVEPALLGAFAGAMGAALNAAAERGHR